jgi:hypothetical protein
MPAGLFLAPRTLEVQRDMTALKQVFLFALLCSLGVHCGATSLTDTLADSPARFVSDTRLLANAQVQGFSDPVPLLRLEGDDWGQHVRVRGARDHAQLQAKLDVGFEMRGWHLSAIARQGGDANASADAVRLAGAINRDEDPALDAAYALDYQMNYWRGQGLRFGGAWQWDLAAGGHLRLGMAAYYLNRVDLLQQELQGQAVPTGANTMLFQGHQLRAGSLMKTSNPARFNPYVRDGSPAGHGHGLDLGANWQISPQWQAELAAFDLASKLSGSDMPRSVRDGRILYDTEGNLIGNADGSAALQGLDSRGDMVMRPQARWLARIAWQQGEWQTDLLLQHHAGVSQMELAGRRSFESGWWLRATAAPRTRSLGLGGGNEWASLSISSSALRARDAHALSIGLRLSWPLNGL